MDDETKLSNTYDTIIDTLNRSGTTLANVDHGRSLLFLLSIIIPEFSFGFVWQKYGKSYKRVAQTLTDKDYIQHASIINQGFGSAAIKETYRFQDVLQASKPIQECTSIKITSFDIKTEFGAILAANYLLLTPLSNGEIAEIYLKEKISEEQFEEIESASKGISECLHLRLLQVFDVLLAKDAFSGNFGEIRGNRPLFRQIIRDMKTWFGEDLKAVNIFTYDPRDRLLYHLETSHLVADEEKIRDYKPSVEIQNPQIFDHIAENIDKGEWFDGIQPEVLHEILADLRDKKKLKNKAIRNGAELLKALLTVIPQEPGTGVAGETALTRIPQLGLDHSDPRWQPSAPEYQDKFFAFMLPIEQIFGIGSSGRTMAAVPLLESGQLWGVLFLNKKERYTSLKLLALWEKAQHISSVLSLFRSFEFQSAIIRGAGRKRNVSTARLALENIHLAVNPIFAIHWQLYGTKGGADHIEAWQFDEKTRRFGPGKPINANVHPFSNGKIRAEIHSRIKNKRIEIIDISEDDSDTKTGLPKDCEFLLKELVRSAILIPAPPYDLLAVYTDEEAEILKNFRSLFEERFSCLWHVENIRKYKGVERVIIHHSKKMKLPLQQAEQIFLSADSNNINILIRGETGTGKELLARRIHSLSGRDGDFNAVNMNEIDDNNLIASTLFGHKKGAFTDAHTDKLGYFEIADGGVLFLDEIGDLSFELQGKLLRVIEEREFTPVGDTEPRKTDVLLITATNQPLEDLVEQGKFRSDLYERLAIFELELPPLKERREDIPLLARYFLNTLYASQNLRFSARAMAALLNYEWPRNVRQLSNLIRQSVTFRSDRNKNILSLGDISKKYVRESTGKFRAENIGKYIGVDNDNESNGWVVFSDETYDIDRESPLEDWSYMALAAFERVQKQGPKIHSYCSIGCGAGLDAVIANHVFDLRRILLSDLNENVLTIAQENVRLNASGLLEINIAESNFFHDIPEDKFDLIYENLPNLPWRLDGPLAGFKMATFTQSFRGATEVSEKWLLTTHENFLREARSFLEPGGRVVCCIGARVPWKSIVEMFEGQGYVPKLVYLGIKKQQQAEEVVNGYAMAEEEGRGKFTFLDLMLARELLGDLPHDANEALKVFESDLIKEARLTATEALNEIKRGEGGRVIGHGVYVVSGEPILNSDE